MRKWLLVHPSDEMYGADRVLLETVGAIGVENIQECWLPLDVNYPTARLSGKLENVGVPVRWVDLPVLRRAYATPARFPEVLSRAARFWRNPLVRGASFDGVFLSTSAVLPVAPLIRRRTGRLVCHVHECWSGMERQVLGRLLRQCDATVAVSQAVRTRLRGDATVIYNGFPDITLPPSGSTGNGRLNVLLASRWSEWKGHREFLTAWGLAGRPDAHLTIVGGTPPSGGGVNVPQVVEESGLGDSVSIIAERGDVSELVRNADLVVVPSVRPDPLPTIAVEAARAGRAVLASECGGLPEIVEDGKTGWLAAPGDVEAWAQALRAISIDEVRRRGLLARRRYLGRFTVERYRREMQEVLSV